MAFREGHTNKLVIPHYRMALSTQVYLKMDRVDKAEQQIKVSNCFI